jgi:hypothetical protein
MKLSAIFQALTIASFSTTSIATIMLEKLSSKLNIGDVVLLNWTVDHDYVSKSV